MLGRAVADDLGAIVEPDATESPSKRPRPKTPAKKRVETRKLTSLLARERALWSEGLVHIAGVDEVGVGPLAGPVVAAAVIFPAGTGIRGVNDSKQLSAEKRAELAGEIRERALAWSVARVEPEMIDQINIYRATLEAMRLAVVGLDVAPDCVLVDARTIPGIEMRQEPIVKGDATCHAIAAASILAKITRDAIMEELEAQYPGYGFLEHKGYSTAAHREAIRRLGRCPVHRRSFQTVTQLKFTDW